MKNFIKKIIICTLSLIIFLSIGNSLLAVGNLDSVPIDTEGGTKKVSDIGSAVGYSTETTATTIFSRVVQVVLGLSGTVALVLVIMSGFYYLLSKGDPGKIKKALAYMYTGFIGIAIMASAYTLSSYIIKQTQRISGPATINNTTPTTPSATPDAIAKCEGYNSLGNTQEKMLKCTNDVDCVYNGDNTNCFAKNSVEDGSVCKDNNWCKSSYCTGNDTDGKKCLTKNSKQNGAPCYENDDCMSSYCKDFNGGKTCLTSPITQTTFCNYSNYNKFADKTIEYLKQASESEFRYCKENSPAYSYDRGVFEVLFGGNTSNCGGDMVAVSYDCYNGSERYDCRICVSDKCSNDETKSICESSDLWKCRWSDSQNKCLRTECDNATTEYDVTSEGGATTKGCRSLSKCSWVNGDCVEK